MSGLSRRDFFKKTAMNAAVMSVVASHVAKLKANPLGLPIGSQTYPHRTRIQCGDLAGLLKDMKAVGIDVIELCDPIGYVNNGYKNIADGKATRKILDDNGIKAVSCHVDMPVYRTKFNETLAWAHDIGLEMLSTASLQGRVVNGMTTENEVRRAAYEYNKFAEQTTAAGMQQILHNEGFENSRLEDGRLTYPVLMQYLDPNLVKMQFQMSSMTTLGSPIMYFTNHPGRFASVHLQGVNATAGMRAVGPGALPTKADPAAPAAGGRGGGAPVDPCAPAGGRAAAPAAAPAAGGAAPAAGRGGGPALALGEDTADWPAIFAAAKIGGLRYAFVEQGWEQTVKSVAYLKTLS